MRRIALIGWVALLGACTSSTLSGGAADEEEELQPGTSVVLGDDAGESDLDRPLAARTLESPFAFVEVGVVYDLPKGDGVEIVDPVQLEVATSADGVTWSSWLKLVPDPELSDPIAGSYAASYVVGDGEARFARLRPAGEIAPSFLSVEFRNADEIAATVDGPDDEPSVEDLALGDGLALSSGDLYVRKFRFDNGYVTRPWLWLLRMARRRGWTGHLLGSSSGLRTYAQQNALWQAYQNGTGNPAFPPWGPSRHLIRNVRSHGLWYQAIDTQDVTRLRRIARNHGVHLRVPYSNEPWHVEARYRFHAPSGWSP